MVGHALDAVSSRGFQTARFQITPIEQVIDVVSSSLSRTAQMSAEFSNRSPAGDALEIISDGSAFLFGGSLILEFHTARVAIAFLQATGSSSRYFLTVAISIAIVSAMVTSSIPADLS